MFWQPSMREVFSYICLMTIIMEIKLIHCTCIHEVLSGHHSLFAPVQKVKIGITKFKLYKKVQGFVETLQICYFK